TLIDVFWGTFSNHTVASFHAHSITDFLDLRALHSFPTRRSSDLTLGTGTATFGIPFNNSGTVSVSSGTLSMNEGGVSSGTFIASSDADTRVLHSRPEITCRLLLDTGRIEFGGGATNLNPTSVYNV